MQFSTLFRSLISVATMLLLAACGGGGGGGGPTVSPPPAPPPPPPPPSNTAPSRVTVTKAIVPDSQPTTGGYRVGTLYADDPEGDTVTLAISGGADAGNFTISGADLLLDDGTLSAVNKDTYEVTIEATDPDGLSATFDLTILVHTSPPLTIGYYDTILATGRAEQATPINVIGETPVEITDLDAETFSGMDVLFFQHPTSAAPTGPFAGQANQDKIADFVNNGGVLIMHDRHVITMADFLPGDAGELTQDVGATRVEFELVEPLSFVAEGPGGTIDGNTLESPNSLSFGFADALSVPNGSIGYLSRNNADHWISYSYPVGFGHVVYSSIPLDFYLLSANPPQMRDIYAPNILAQARALREQGTDDDNDGLLDVEEAAFGTLTDNDDSDADTINDLYEVRNGLNPNDASDADADPDADGLTNLEEFGAGTLARDPDSDRDGINDGEEVNDLSTNPLLADTDGDGLDDGEEVGVYGTDPTLADTDTGGTDDGREVLVDGTDPLDPADDLASIDLPTTLNDVNGFIWDIQRDGNINNGTSDAYDGGMRLIIDGQQFGQFATGSLTINDRQVTIGNFGASGLNVRRSIYVPSDQAFVRYLDAFSNPTNADIAVQIQINTNLGSDGGTVIVSTTDGDATIEPTDTWVVTDDASDGAGDPSLAHVTAGAGGSIIPVIAAPLGSILYTYDITVPANSRAIIMHFDSQNANRAAAIASAGALAGLGAGTLDGMSADERADVINFNVPQPATTSRPAAKPMHPLCEADGGC